MSGSPANKSSRKPTGTPAHLSRRRFAVFIGVFAILILSTNAASWATFAHFLGIQRWESWQLISGIVLLGFIPATIFGRNHSGVLLRSFYACTAAALGLLNYCFFAALACWGANGLATMLSLPISHFSLGTASLGIGTLIAVAGVANAAWIRTTHITIALDRLPKSWENRTAAMVTDIHLGHIAGPFYLRRVLAHLRGMNPDIVFVSGDMFDGTTAGIQRLAQPWSTFTVPLGTWFVTGNHDEFEDRRIYLDELARVGVRVLNNEKIVVEGLQLLGVHDREASHPESYRAKLQRMQIDPHMPSILLNHQPANLRVAEEAGVSLQLSGHTHNGQFWPWNLLVRQVWRQFAYGLNRLDRLQVFTSSGVGAWGPPLRIGTRSEIVLIRFTESRK